MYTPLDLVTRHALINYEISHFLSTFSVFPIKRTVIVDPVNSKILVVWRDNLFSFIKILMESLEGVIFIKKDIKTNKGV